MIVPEDLRYTKTHEWAKQVEHEVVVGITAHAQEELRDVVYVELPEVGKTVKQGEPTAVVESVKAAFEIYAPVSGTVSRINTALTKSPQLVNQDCYGVGWFFAVNASQPHEFNALLGHSEYAKLIQTPSH